MKGLVREYQCKSCQHRFAIRLPASDDGWGLSVPRLGDRCWDYRCPRCGSGSRALRLVSSKRGRTMTRQALKGYEEARDE